MRTMFYTALLLMAACSSACGQIAQEFCRQTSLDLTPTGIDISANEFEAYTSNVRSGGRLVLANRTAKPIKRIMILVSLLKEDGGYVLTLPFYASVKPEEKPPFAVIAGTDLQKPLEPGQVVALSADVYPSTSRCPKSARAALVDVSFSDGTAARYAGQQWKLEASLIYVEPMNFRTFPRELPFEATVDAVVDVKGHMGSVNISDVSEQVLDWFRVQLSKWSFAPAIEDGKPAISKVRLIFRMHKIFDKNDPTRFDEAVFGGGLVTAIDVFPKGNPDRNEQFLLAGGMPLVTPK